MTTQRLSGLAALVLLSAALVLVAPQARAVTLIPPSLEFSDVQPGTAIPSKLKLFNETATTITLYSQTANFTALDETGTPNIDLNSTKEGLASWITIEPGPFTLEPGQRVEVPFTITLPADAPPGGHYASVLFSPQQPGTAGQGQVAITQKIGTLVLVRVAGTINESGSIAQFIADNGSTKFSRLPVDFLVRFQNSGNVHLRPTGNLTIRNVLGGTTIVIPINSELGATLPQSVRKYDAIWEKSVDASTHGNFFQEVGREWRNFAFGPYTASVALTFGQANDKTATATLQFWVFPWRVLLVSLLVIAAIVAIIILIVRQYNRWIIAKAKEQPKQK